MLTSSGPHCDVCGKYILPIINEKVEWFKVTGVAQMLCCHDDCRKILERAAKEKDWKLLPEGPLRKVFQEQEEK